MNISSCSEDSCSSCAREDGCAWCEAGTVSPGRCISLETELCRKDVLVDDSRCPGVVGVDVALTNLTVLFGMIVGAALILRVSNRVLNKRRSTKLQKSIFTLPVYVFNGSTRRRSLVLTEARPQSQTPSVSLHGIHEAGPARSSSALASESGSCSSSENGDNVSAFTCTICISPYVEEDLVKVLPCGHDFHSDCLDSWLAVKPKCPLCKTPAFDKSRIQDRHRHGQARVEGLSPAAAAPPLRGSLPSNQLHSPRLDGSGRSRGETGGGLLVMRPSSSPPPHPSADVGVVNPPQASAAQQSGGAPGTVESEAGAPVPAKAVEVGRVEDVRVALHVQRGVGAPEETMTETMTASTALDDRELKSGAATTGGGSPVEPADCGGGKGQGNVGFPSEPCSPCHGGGTRGAAPGDGRREVPLSELELGQVGSGKASS